MDFFHFISATGHSKVSKGVSAVVHDTLDVRGEMFSKVSDLEAHVENASLKSNESGDDAITSRRVRRSYTEPYPRYLVRRGQVKKGGLIWSLISSFNPPSKWCNFRFVFQRLPEGAWMRRPWRPESSSTFDDRSSSNFQSSHTDIYLKNTKLVDGEEAQAPASSPVIDSVNEQAKHTFSPSAEPQRPGEEGVSASEKLTQTPEKRDEALPTDLLASAGQSLARNFMKRRRGGRMYDVPQIGKCQSAFSTGIGSRRAAGPACLPPSLNRMHFRKSLGSDVKRELETRAFLLLWLTLVV